MCVCVCTEKPDIPNLKQGNYFPINVKSLSILLRAHARTVTTTYRVVPTMQSSFLLIFSWKANKSIGSQFWRFWFTWRNLIFFTFFMLVCFTKKKVFLEGAGRGSGVVFDGGYRAFLITTFLAFLLSLIKNRTQHNKNLRATKALVLWVTPACGIWNPVKTAYKKSEILGFGIRNKAQGIQNPKRLESRV